MKKGFTLIELLVVVLIIGILSAVAMPQYTKSVEKARQTEALSNIRTLEQELSYYVLSNGLPSETEYYKDFATVELSGGAWEDQGGRPVYKTKYFDYYTALCNSRGCQIEVYGYEGGNRDLGAWYAIYSTNFPQDNYNTNKVGEWYHSCVTEINEYGRKMCKLLEGQGWTYNDSEL